MDRSVKSKPFTLNKGQRLIAISDIHGSLGLLRQLLAKVRYVPVEDVLVLAGDLIEKGPQSLASLR